MVESTTITPMQQLADAQLGALGSNPTHTLENAALLSAQHHIIFGIIGIALLVLCFIRCKLWQKPETDGMKAILLVWALSAAFFVTQAISPLYQGIENERQIGVAHGVFK